MRRSILWPAIAALALVTAACGDGGGADDASTVVAASGSTTPPTTADGDESSTSAAQSTSDECLDGDEMSRIVGEEMVFDEEYATNGGAGLMFCPYFQVEDQLSALSYTYTNLDVTQAAVGYEDDYEEVTGVGERAIWDGFSDLSVWTGDRGLIVSAGTFRTSDGSSDAKALAVTIATALQ